MLTSRPYITTKKLYLDYLKRFTIVLWPGLLIYHRFLTFNGLLCFSITRKIITVNPRWVIAVSTARFISCSLTIRYTNMRTSRLIWKGSADSVIDTNIRNSCIFLCMHSVTHYSSPNRLSLCKCLRWWVRSEATWVAPTQMARGTVASFLLLSGPLLPLVILQNTPVWRG